jgi:serine/threonine-protein kinase HipA
VTCRICLGESTTGAYHARCLRELFGTARLPAVDVDTSKLHTLALAMVGHTSLSGVQRKISLGLSTDRKTLQLALEGGRYLLKPQAQTYPHLPENEHTTMRLARLFRIEIPPCGLVQLLDGSTGYIVRRFDRPAEGGKLAQEDFCQLAEKPPRAKYDGSTELCARLVRRFASEPKIALLHLFRRIVFTYWTGNGDMHLKNFALLTDRAGLVGLTPAYDLLSTRLSIPDDQLALPIGGKRDRLRRRNWLELAEHMELPPKSAERLLAEVGGTLPRALALVGRSALPDDLKHALARLLEERVPSFQE